MLDVLSSSTSSPTTTSSTTDSLLSTPMDTFQFGSPPTKTEDQMDIPFASFDDDLDHRKRRRNRTTQSCWSCHQAKRKCDRKRPCSRCIQLGLTGLCVYETDDPASRDDPSLSETQRLRKRIAELEALVREMKNKPHPRWADKVQSGNIGVDKWHTRAKYVVGSSPGGLGTGGGGGGSVNGGSPADGFDDYHYRFPPLDGANGYDSSFSSSHNTTTTVVPPGFDDEARRLSIASSTSVSSSSSPRTPYGYPHPPPTHHHHHPHHPHHPHPHHHQQHHGVGLGMLSNPCSCLTTTPNTARSLASAIRNVVLESGITHPYSEGCKVLALVRELEAVADTSPCPSSSSQQQQQHTNYYRDHHSNSGSPHPPPPSSSTTTTTSTTSSGSPMTHPSLPHPLHSIAPPPPTSTTTNNGGLPSTSTTTSSRPHLSYYPSINTLTSLGSYGNSSNHHHHHYSSPGSDDGLPQQQQQQAPPPPQPPTTVASMSSVQGYPDFGVDYSSPHSASPARSHHSHGYPLTVV